AFAEGQRRNSQMGPLAADLTDNQIKLLAAYFARQTPDRNEAVAGNLALERRGQATAAAKNCAASHGEHPTGGPLGPRLAGQGEIYLTGQLAAFKLGELKDPTQAMNQIAGSLSEEEIKTTARYVAGLAPASK